MTHLPHSHGGHTEDLFGHMPAPEEFTASADLFKLMSDGTRIKLFWLLCHCEECLLNLSAMMEMSSPALSHHLKWIDVYPSKGKSSGAFSEGSLRSVHPYVLLNHNDNLDSAQLSCPR